MPMDDAPFKERNRLKVASTVHRAIKRIRSPRLPRSPDGLACNRQQIRRNSGLLAFRLDDDRGGKAIEPPIINTTNHVTEHPVRYPTSGRSDI
jgi:hypothetical protein